MAKSPRTSAGILMFRRSNSGLEVLLSHPGGPFWAKRDAHAWSIPKGEFQADEEEPIAAARREFEEEMGSAVTGPVMPLSPLKQPGGKLVHAFAVEQDFDPSTLTSNTFALEWPPRSGRTQHYPEVDRAAWFTLDLARTKLLPGQVPFLDQLERALTVL